MASARSATQDQAPAARSGRFRVASSIMFIVMASARSNGNAAFSSNESELFHLMGTLLFRAPPSSLASVSWSVHFFDTRIPYAEDRRTPPKSRERLTARCPDLSSVHLYLDPSPSGTRPSNRNPLDRPPPNLTLPLPRLCSRRR